MNVILKNSSPDGQEIQVSCGDFFQICEIDSGGEQTVTFTPANNNELQFVVMQSQDGTGPTLETVYVDGSWNSAVNTDPDKLSFGMVDDQWTFTYKK